MDKIRAHHHFKENSLSENSATRQMSTVFDICFTFREAELSAKGKTMRMRENVGEKMSAARR